MKKTFLLVIILALLVFSGCSMPAREQAVKETEPVEPTRFAIVEEQGETKNLGGYTLLRDTVTGKEYLVITGLNGAPTVIQMQ